MSRALALGDFIRACENISVVAGENGQDSVAGEPTAVASGSQSTPTEVQAPSAPEVGVRELPPPF